MGAASELTISRSRCTAEGEKRSSVAKSSTSTAPSARSANPGSVPGSAARTPPTTPSGQPCPARIRSPLPSPVSSRTDTYLASSSRAATATAWSTSSPSGSPPSARWPSSATAACWRATVRSCSSALWLTAGLVGLRERIPLEARLESKHGLRVQLGHPRLGDPEHLSDLSKGQVLVVVEGHDELL